MLKFGQSYVDKGMEHYEDKYRRNRSTSNSLHLLKLSNEFLETHYGGAPLQRGLN